MTVRSSPTSTRSSSPASALSNPLTGLVIDWYNDKTRASDEDLLEEYFRENPGLAQQVFTLKTHKHLRQTDADIICDYKFALAIHDILKERKWAVCSKWILLFMFFNILAERSRRLGHVHHQVSRTYRSLVYEGTTSYQNPSKDWARFP